MTCTRFDSVPWEEFDRARVHPQLLAFARGACLVEYNADLYSEYLCRVFGDDAELQSRIRTWADEEKQHGLVLKKWVELADPEFDFDRSFSLFCTAYRQLPDDGNDSVRGSRARELVARCIVECGTSSFYSALRDASDDPVFKEICRLIALDEVRHFNFFRKALEGKYGALEKLGLFARLKVVAGRMLETSDEELSFAYRAGNFPDDAIEHSRLREYSNDYMRRVAHLYEPGHWRLGLGLAMKAAGINASQRIRTILGHTAHYFLRCRYSSLRTAEETGLGRR